MKKLLIISIFTLFAYTSHAQISIGADINMGASNHFLSGEDEVLIEAFYKTYDAKFNYHASIYSILPLSAKTNLSLGVGLLRLGRTNTIELNIENPPYDKVVLNDDFLSLTLPIRLEHQLLDRKIRYYITYGVTPQFFLNNQLKSKFYNNGALVDEETSSPYNELFRDFNISVYLGNKFQYAINDKFDVLLNVGVEGQILPAVESEALDTRFYLISAGTGIAFKL